MAKVKTDATKFVFSTGIESATRHFTSYLIKEGIFANGLLVDKKDIMKIYKTEYLPQYHVRMNPYMLLVSLFHNRYVEKQRRSRNKQSDILFFSNKVIEKLSRELKTEASLAPQVEVSMTEPVVKVHVTQQHAFKMFTKRGEGFTQKECKVCRITFSDLQEFEKHIAKEEHRVRELYRTKKKFLQGNHTINIRAETSSAMETIILRQATLGSIQITISNIGKENQQILKMYDLCELNEISRGAVKPFNLKPGQKFQFMLDYKFYTSGVFIYPIVLKISTTSKEDSPFCLKEFVFQVQSELMDHLQPTAPYKRPSKNVQKRNDAPIVYGKALPPITSALISVRKLGLYETPGSVRRVLNHGLNPWEDMQKTDMKKLKEIRSLLGGDNTITTKLLKEKQYCKFFRLLLNIEEHQMENDICMYDCENQTMTIVKENKELLSLTVPGLSENRPSVLKGDSIFVMIQNNKSVKYEGVVHNVRQSEVWLAFHSSFRDKFLPNMKFHVEFQFNRWTIRHQHRALELIENRKASKFLFPINHKQLQSSNASNVNSWYNYKLLEKNPQQQQAVRSIMSGTSYPAPYLIFGPPGTGKTVTIVEAITQLYHLKKPNGHLLACTPSNSAANEITKRLLMSCSGHVPDSAILRLYSSSYNPLLIPTELLKCCNYYKNDYYYPSKEDIMKYNIVIVTLSTAGRLVSGDIPPGHFTHLFIDESGQAIEPETLIPVAGLFTSSKQSGKLYGQLILAGDPKQLGSVLHSAVADKLGLSTSILERLMDTCTIYKKDENTNMYNSALLTKLVQNFRSHPKILELPDKMFYDNELKACGNPDLISLACNWEGLPQKGFPVIFHGVKGRDLREGNSPSYFNIQEIDVIVKYVERLLRDRLCGRRLRYADIGIITPYRKQVQKIRKAFAKKNWDAITVGSVEEFQGQERLVIIISTVRSNMELMQEDYKFHLGFLKNAKRFNVALTRSKALLIIVGDPNVLQTDKHWRELLLFCLENNSYIGCKFLPSAVPQEEEEEEEEKLSFKFASLNIADGRNGIEDPKWRNDI